MQSISYHMKSLSPDIKTEWHVFYASCASVPFPRLFAPNAHSISFKLVRVPMFVFRSNVFESNEGIPLNAVVWLSGQGTYSGWVVYLQRPQPARHSSSEHP